jgi:hypothetical protein
MIGKGECDASGAGEEAGVRRRWYRVRGAGPGTGGQGRMPCRSAPPRPGETRMAARGLKDPGVTVAEGRSFYVPALRVARRQRSHRVVGCGPVSAYDLTRRSAYYLSATFVGTGDARGVAPLHYLRNAVASRPWNWRSPFWVSFLALPP